MKKNEYKTPKTEVFEMKAKQSLLAGSGDLGDDEEVPGTGTGF